MVSKGIGFKMVHSSMEHGLLHKLNSIVTIIVLHISMIVQIRNLAILSYLSTMVIPYSLFVVVINGIFVVVDATILHDVRYVAL